MQPEDLLVNDFLFNSGRATPILDPATFELEVSGRVAHPRKFSLQELQSLPAATVTMRHVCVEGWAAIVRWTGVPLKVLADLVQPEADVRYVYFFSADNYYESWDLASATHPQTLMVYGMNDGPLAQAHGAPIRLASPIKLGYKQSKWVTAIGFTSILLPQKGYWEDQGYEWFAGL
jgi:DMSO/TMAO reductase YedYZ molybdopterin-dependent catalytic subunit